MSSCSSRPILPLLIALLAAAACAGEPAEVDEVRLGYFGPADPDDPQGGDLWRAAQLAVDKATADREKLAVGDEVTYLTDTGQYEGTITATIGLGSADSFGGAALVALDLDTALINFGAGSKVDVIDIKVDDGADVAEVQLAIADAIPTGTEVVTGENEITHVFGSYRSILHVPVERNGTITMGDRHTIPIGVVDPAVAVEVAIVAKGNDAGSRGDDLNRVVIHLVP